MAAPATVYWIGNQAAVAEIVNITISAVTANGVINVTINTKVVSYTVQVSDTTTTAATALAALLAACQFPEFLEATWTSTNNVISATAVTPGTPIYSTRGWGISINTVGAGTTASLSVAQPNLSPSDIADPLNWVRGGINALPQNGDNIIIADNSVPLLWNLDQFPVPGTYTRWQSFTATIGLPEVNPSGYQEYRPTYLSCVAATSSSSSSSGQSSSPIKAIIGQGTLGQGPSRERYNFGSNQTAWIIRAAGTPADDYSVRVLGTNAQTTLQITGTSVGVAMLPNESASFATASVDGGGSLDIGLNVTVNGPTSGAAAAISLIGASADLFCAVPTLSMQQGASAVVLSTAVNYPSVTCVTGSTLTWDSDSSITTFVLQNGSNFDCSGDVRPFQIGTLSIDADTCQVNDPNNRTQIQNAVLIGQRVIAGPFIFGSGRSFKIT